MNFQSYCTLYIKPDKKEKKFIIRKINDDIIPNSKKIIDEFLEKLNKHIKIQRRKKITNILIIIFAILLFVIILIFIFYFILWIPLIIMILSCFFFHQPSKEKKFLKIIEIYEKKLSSLYKLIIEKKNVLKFYWTNFCFELIPFFRDEDFFYENLLMIRTYSNLNILDNIIPEENFINHLQNKIPIITVTCDLKTFVDSYPEKNDS